jgi:GLPGLI family protein
VVVAFYTDEIIPSGGPESFGGMPGMILGLSIPRLYTTWFATKLEVLNDQDIKKITAPAKGKSANSKEMIDKVNKGIRDWGEKYRSKAIWFVTL